MPRSRLITAPLIEFQCPVWCRGRPPRLPVLLEAPRRKAWCPNGHFRFTPARPHVGADLHVRPKNVVI